MHVLHLVQKHFLNCGSAVSVAILTLFGPGYFDFTFGPGGGRILPPLLKSHLGPFLGVSSIPPKTSIKLWATCKKLGPEPQKPRNGGHFEEKNSDGRRHIHIFLKKSYFIFYKYHQGLVFGKNFNFVRTNFSGNW